MRELSFTRSHSSAAERSSTRLPAYLSIHSILAKFSRDVCLRFAPPSTMSRSSASQPRISCKAGISLESLSHVNVNESPLQVSSAIFQGQLAISIQDYLGPKGREGTPNPADGFKGREGHTWSIAVQGRFLDELTADDLVRGFCGLPFVFS